MRDYIDYLEELISQEDKKKVNLIFALLLCLVLFAIYYFFIDPKIEEISQKKESLSSLDKKIANMSPKNLESKMVVKKREILENRGREEKIRLKILSLESQLNRMNFLFVDSLNFSSFLDYLLKRSIKNSLLINGVKIKKEEKPFIGKLYVKKSIYVNGTGSFLSIVRFARELEDQQMLFSLNDFNIETNGSIPNFSFQIDFYGVKN